MYNTLRNRLILSHILPLLILVPLVGIALIYVLETRVILPYLSDELAQQAALMVEIAADHPDIWSDTTQARTFVDRFGDHHQARTMLIDSKGRLLASSNLDDSERVGQLLDLPNMSSVLAGESSVQLKYSQSVHTEVVDVLMPVVDSHQQIVGMVRLTHQLSTIFDQFLRLRYLIVGVLAVGLLLGIAIGLILALDLEHSLRQVTEAIYEVANGRQWISLPEQGPQEIRLLLRAFNTLTERLQVLEEARRHLLANLVHEVSRPMGALKSAVEALLRGVDEDAAVRRELLEGMVAEFQRLQPLLNNLTELHGQVLGLFDMDCRPTALGHWLGQTISPWRAAAQAKGLVWQVALPDSLPTLEVDPDRLAQALGNLLSNAIKYTPKGGVVSIAAGIAAEGVWIQVSDTGPGLSAEEQTHIFEPFYRSHAHTRFPQGMGLGLTIARDLVIAHEGRLEVDSKPGEGSCFTIWLPQPPVTSQRENAAEQPQPISDEFLAAPSNLT